jgi:mono/diheme cytochrome c family protein
MILADLLIDGASRKVIMQAPKPGFFYVLDRRSGKLISAEKYAPVNWAERIDMNSGGPVENPDARYVGKPFLITPGALGAHSWQAMSFSPKTGLVYLPVMVTSAFFDDDPNFKFRPGRWNIGVTFMRSKLPTSDADRASIAASMKGWLSAWDPIKQKEVWRAELKGPWNGGTLATAGGLVFEGASDHTFSAYDSANGQKLWSFEARSAIIGAPITYEIHDVQYVAVLSGNGGALPLGLAAFQGPSPPVNGRVLVFKLGGAAVLPAAPRVTIPPIVPIEADRSPVTIEHGRVLFADNCAACHGMGAWSAGVVPDLRRSGALADTAAWKAVVMDGALQDEGMISFKSFLSPQDAEAIRAYLANETRVISALETENNRERNRQ